MKNVKGSNQKISDKKIVSDVTMVFVDRDIKIKEDLGDLSKGDLVKMLFKISNQVDYWKFLKEASPFDD